MKRFLPAILAVLLLPFLWWLIPRCEFRAAVEIDSDGQTVRFRLNGQTLEAPLELKQIHELEIRAIESPFPVGARELVVEQDGQGVCRETLPQRFETQPGKQPALGDWWVDEKYVRPAHPVYRRPLALDGPFTLKAVFTGRNLQGTVLRLTGQAGAEFFFRCGLLNNDLWIKNQGNLMVKVAAVEPHPLPLLASILEPFLRGLAVACILVIAFTLLGWSFSGIYIQLIRPESARGSGESENRAIGGSGDLKLETGGVLNPPITGSPDHQIKKSAIGHSWLSGWRAVLTVGLLAMGSLILSLWVASDVLWRLPHFQDDLCYLLRAKWLAAGWLSQPIPAFWEALDIPHTYFSSVTGRWLTIYPIGWPLLLAAGVWLGAAWAVPPVCGAVAMVLIYLLGRELYGPWTGLAAMGLAILSPMSVLMSASLLSHAATAMCLTLFFYGLVSGWKRRSYWRLAVAGLALGYTFGIRPLTAVAVAVPAGLFLLIELVRLARRKRCDPGKESVVQDMAQREDPLDHATPGESLVSATPNLEPARFCPWWGLSLLVLGGVLGTLPALYDNYYATGSPFLFAYTAGPKQHHWTLDNLPGSLLQADATLAAVLPMAFGWGYRLVSGWPVLALTYAFALVVFLSGRASKYDWLLLGTYLAVPLAYLGHDSSGGHGYGPRFYYDVFFALFLLTARGFGVLGELGGRARWATGKEAAGGGHALLEKPDVTRWSLPLARLLPAGLFLALCVSTAVTLPGRVKLYRGYNEITREFEDTITKSGITRGIILLENPSHIEWIQAANLLPADVNHGDFIIAAKLEDNSLLFDAHPDLPTYLWAADLLLPYKR